MVPPAQARHAFYLALSLVAVVIGCVLLAETASVGDGLRRLLILFASIYFAVYRIMLMVYTWRGGRHG